MGEFFKQLIAQLSSIWQKLSVQQRIIISSLVGFMFVSLIGLVLWSSSGMTGGEKMRRLYGGVSTEDLAEITAQLTSSGYKYEIEENGTAIFVEKDKYYDIKMALAAEGLPADNVLGDELWDKTSFGETDIAQNKKLQRSMEGELTRTIRSLKQIKDARVHLVFSESSLFLEDASKAKASIKLTTRGNRSLSKEQIRGISYLVASSVKGLESENISIIDQTGRLLSSAYKDDETALMSSRNMELEAGTEKVLTSKVEKKLRRILGEGEFDVTIDVDLDFDQIQKSLEIYDPESKVVRSEERNEAEVKNAPDGDQGNESMVSNYEINKTVENIIKEVGNIKRLSIAVAINGITESEEGKEATYRDRTPEELRKFEAQIKTAVGFDVARGDIISVESMRFNNQFLEEMKLEEEKSDQFETIKIGITWGVLALVLGIAIYVISQVGKAMSEAMNPPLPEVELPSSIEDDEIIAEIPENVARSNELLEKVEIMAENDPNNVAKIIRDWLNESPQKKQSS